MPAFVTGMPIIILFHIHFLSNIFYCYIQYVQTVCASCLFISLDVFSACGADTAGVWWEDMIVVGTSGGGDDLVCNVVIFLGRVDFFRAYRGFDVYSVGISLPLWTSACIFVALTSILWLFLALFGLLTCLSPLRSPICHGFLLLLDFWRVPHRLEVQPLQFYST